MLMLLYSLQRRPPGKPVAGGARLADRMPFLRFSRDKRGYANTYLCHTFRQDGAVRMRVLYWFRTPPDIEIGRPALDADAIRDIEKSNPDLTFDWDEILKAKPQPQPVARDQAGGGRTEGRSRRRDRGPETGGRGTPADSREAPAPAPRQHESPPDAPDAPSAESGDGTGERPAALDETTETPRASSGRRRGRRGRRDADDSPAPAESASGTPERPAPVEPDSDRT